MRKNRKTNVKNVYDPDIYVDVQEKYVVGIWYEKKIRLQF